MERTGRPGEASVVAAEEGSEATPDGPVRALTRAYPGRGGRPVLHAVNLAVFRHAYFARCLDCTFCHDACCAHGVDIDLANVRRLLEQADELERFLGVPREAWFEPAVEEDDEAPGGAWARTRADAMGCVFKNRAGRGCRLHAFAVERGLDYHLFKPMISALFPLTFCEGVLEVAEEIEDRSLVCGGSGVSLYRGVRDELRHYFGEALVEELDALEARWVVHDPGDAARRLPMDGRHDPHGPSRRRPGSR